MAANTPNLKGEVSDAAGTSMLEVAKAIKVLLNLPEKRIPTPIKAVYGRRIAIISARPEILGGKSEFRKKSWHKSKLFVPTGRLKAIGEYTKENKRV